MPTSKNPFLATAAALVLGWSMLVPMPLAAQDDHKPEATTKTKTTKPSKQVEASTAPPRNLKKVGDHWTPYNPPDPESFPEGASLHIIVPGETLWGMADLTYNNPYLWPQLWNENRYVTDSHWIYPGDPLLVPARPVVVTDAGPAAAPEIVPQGQEGAPSTSLAPLTGPEEAEQPIQQPLAAEKQGSGAPAPAAGRFADSQTPVPHLVYEHEVRCTGFIAEDSKRGDLFIAEGEEQKFQRLTEGSIVYLNHGKDDPRMQPGAEFSIVEREGKVLHPLSDKAEGFYYNRRGGVKILRVLPDTAVATITYACDEIRVGNELQVYEASAIPERPVPHFDRLRFERNGKATGVVIHTKDTVDDVGTGHMVDIDLGQEDGIAPGDFLTAFEPVGRAHRPHQSDYHYKFDGEVFYGTDLHYDNDGKEYPAKPVGQMIVVRTGSHTATAKIIYAVIEMHVGTMVEVD